jgi:ABC-type glycerol-3-phosphate transport system substrate-binding protein
MSVYVDAAPFLGYNVKNFTDAGLADSNGKAKPPANWVDLKADAVKLNKPNAPGFIFQASLNTNDVNIFEGVAYANGGRWIDDAGSKVVINDQGVVDALQLYVDMVKANAAPSNVVQTDFGAAGTLFMNGTGAMWNCMSWIGAFAQGNQPKFEWGSTVFPTPDKPSGSFPPASLIMTTTLGFMVTTLSTLKPQAMQYIDFWTTPDAQKAWDGSVVWGRVPALTANWESDTFKKLTPDWYAQYKAGTFFKGALPMPMFSGLTDTEQMLSTNIQKCLLGQMTPKQALDDVQKNAQPIYDQLNNL